MRLAFSEYDLFDEKSTPFVALQMLLLFSLEAAVMFIVSPVGP